MVLALSASCAEGIERRVVIVGPAGQTVPFYTSPDAETPVGAVEPGSEAFVERTSERRVLVALRESVAEKGWVKKESTKEVVTMPDGVQTILWVVGLAAITALVTLGLNLLPPSARRLVRTGGMGAFFAPVPQAPSGEQGTIATALGSGGVALFTQDAEQKIAQPIHSR